MKDLHVGEGDTGITAHGGELKAGRFLAPLSVDICLPVDGPPGEVVISAFFVV